LAAAVACRGTLAGKPTLWPGRGLKAARCFRWRLAGCMSSCCLAMPPLHRMLRATPAVTPRCSCASASRRTALRGCT
jgi:hypothetical protein